LKDAKYKVKKLMEIYRDTRHENETFEAFDSRVLSLMSVDEVIAIIETA